MARSKQRESDQREPGRYRLGDPVDGERDHTEAHDGDGGALVVGNPVGQPMGQFVTGPLEAIPDLRAEVDDSNDGRDQYETANHGLEQRS